MIFIMKGITEEKERALERSKRKLKRKNDEKNYIETRQKEEEVYCFSIT